MGLINVLKTCQTDENKVIQITDAELSLIQKRLLEVLDDISNVCEQYGIQYLLGGGSCLGAVRHQGFIPWDDDIDIIMYRKDISLFVEKFTEIYEEKYWIHLPGQPDYDYMMIHIMTKDIRARGLMDHEKKECGLCVDVFILENTFDNRLLRNIHGIGAMMFRYVLSCIRFKKCKEELSELVENSEALGNYYRKRLLWGKIFSIIPDNIWIKGANRWVQICKDNNSKYIVFVAGSKQFFEEMYERRIYSETIHVRFEGRIVAITKDYDNYMKLLYGSTYMNIPPENKREKHVFLELDREALHRFDKICVDNIDFRQTENEENSESHFMKIQENN